MRLRNILAGYSVQRTTGNLDVDISGIAYDSRQVLPGSLFVAIRGLRTDGNQFVSQSLAKGAAAVVSSAEVAEGVPVPWIQVADDRDALAILSANFYERPTEKLHAIGVTGTNGKTTTTYLIESMLGGAGMSAAVFGTIEYRGPDFSYSAERTTPEASDLQLLFKRVADAGWNYAVMEVSSHAIALKRVEGLHFDVAVFTNLSRDHLDFHQDMRSYFEAKKRLFTGLDGAVPRVLVLNSDDSHFDELRSIAPDRVISYGMRTAADVHPRPPALAAKPLALSPLPGGQLVFETPAGEIQVKSKLIGRPNLYNTSAAIGVGIGLGLSPDAIARGIAALPSVPGRFQPVEAGQPFRVVVDYAHTDDALENALRTARELTNGKVIVVFGCGGDRDRTKRPVMGEVAARSSDLAVVTSDNPRSEDPLAIIHEVERGFTNAGAKAGEDYVLIADRRAAIRHALQRAEPGDIVVVAGKGHEPYQVIGTQTLSFDDRIVVRELLDELKAGRN
jgi:UDP-N-acetylmuramoyl-L-alanyl-D-glutamate--2,6-diaminopimelate ligase